MPWLDGINDSMDMSFSKLWELVIDSIVNEAEVDVYLEFSCFFYKPMDVGKWISGSSAFSKSSLNIWKFSVHTLLKPSLESFQYYFASM